MSSLQDMIQPKGIPYAPGEELPYRTEQDVCWHYGREHCDPNGAGACGDLGCQQHAGGVAQAYMMPMTHGPTPHWQQPGGVHGGFANGACPNDVQQVMWAPCQNVSMQATHTQMSQQDNTCQTQMHQESPSKGSPQVQRKTIPLEAAPHVLQMLQLEVPNSVKVLQKELSEEQGQPQQQERRVEQLQRQLDLVQQMQQQLLAQAAGILSKRRCTSLQQVLGQHQQWGHANAGMPWCAPGSMNDMHGSEDALPQHFGGTTPPMKQRSLRKVPVRPGMQRPPLNSLDGATPRLGTGPQATPRNGQKPTTAPAATDAARRGPPADVADTMKTQLQALQQEEPEMVFIARRINKLGFNSADQLRSHFLSYGEVKCVHVSHSRVKSMRPDVQWRMRAASLGFVVMASAQSTRNILRDGPEHVVSGVAIRVYTFHKLGCPQASEEEGGTLENQNLTSSMVEADASRLSAAVAQSQLMRDMSSFESLFHFGPLSHVSKEELTKALPEHYED